MTEILKETITSEEIALTYAAALDSVNLLNSEKPEFITEEEWADTIKRNVDHLELMVAKDFWTNEDLSPLHKAIAAQ